MNTSNKSNLSGFVLGSLIGLGIVLRVLVWWFSVGTNDVALWRGVGQDVVLHGLPDAYRADVDCNQPPLQPLWAAASFRLSGGDELAFARWFKVPLLLADAAAIGLIYGVMRRRRGSRAALATSAVYALSPIAILAAGYHGNLDPLPATLAFAAVVLMEQRIFLVAGLVLGLAINVKLIPILLLPALFLSFQDRRDALRFLGGLAIMALPSFVMLVLAPTTYFSRVLNYSGLLSHWGIGHVLTELAKNTDLAAPAVALSDAWFARGKYVMLGAIILFAIVSTRRREKWDRHTISAGTMCLFLILAPAFGLQYLIYPLALLTIAAPRAAWAYSIVGGAFMILAYWITWDGTFPIHTTFSPAIDPLPGRVFGQLCWATLIFAFVAVCANRERSSTTL